MVDITHKLQRPSLFISVGALTLTTTICFGIAALQIRAIKSLTDETNVRDIGHQLLELASIALIVVVIDYVVFFNEGKKKRMLTAGIAILLVYRVITVIKDDTVIQQTAEWINDGNLKINV